MSETRKTRTWSLHSLARSVSRAGTRSHRVRATMLCMALGVTATVSAAPAARDMVRPTAPRQESKPKHRWFEIGKASWYGGSFNGRQTANGERFNSSLLTCAHRSLPLGSWIRVTNLQNNKSTLVRVTDRGPFVKNVVLDLSQAAARQLGFTSTARVRIDQVHPGDAAPAATQNLAQLELPHQPAVARADQ